VFDPAETLCGKVEPWLKAARNMHEEDDHA